MMGRRVCCARVLRVCAVTAALLVGPACYGQRESDSQLCGVLGEVLDFPAGSALQVELANLSNGGSVSAFVSGNGSFGFDAVPAGDYVLRLTDSYGNAITERQVSISGSLEQLTIRYPRQQVEQPVTGTISVGELKAERNIASKALNEFRKGVTAFQKRDYKKAETCLESAVAIDPSFANAHNELGAVYTELNQPEKAADEFRRAAEMDPDSPIMLYNLARTMLALDRYPDAETAVRAALQKDPSSAAAHFVLGFSLYMQKRGELEAIQNLDWAANKFPKARLVAAAIFQGLARNAEAAGELLKYLQAPAKGVDQHQVESWLSALESPSSSPGGGAQNVGASTGSGNAIP